MEQEKTRTEEVRELRAEVHRSFTELREKIGELENLIKGNLELYDSLSRDYYARIDKK